MEVSNDNKIVALNTAVDDPNLQRKREATDVVQLHNNQPLPSVVEISESGTCNRVCSFCPRSDPNFEDIKNFISFEMIEKLAAQLSEVNYQGLVLFSGFVEPLLDKNIFAHIKKIRCYLPNARIEIVSNGDPLTLRVLDKLEDSGVDRVLLSLYDGPHQVEEINLKVANSRLSPDKIFIRERWFSAAENFGISLSNRAGMMENAEFSIQNLSSSMKTPCFYPTHTFFLNYTGEVLMCAHDWGMKRILGNFNNQSFLDIWFGKEFESARSKLIGGNRNISPCDVCNVQGTRMGKNHALHWVKLAKEQN
ncbi:SPASM domain-containing protein [Alphaproteobacteria bacterium]|nr:SPASM domain-containing protein [Alphaproteobacteria bacterium]